MPERIDILKWYVHRGQVDGLGGKAHRYIQELEIFHPQFAWRVCAAGLYAVDRLDEAGEEWSRCKLCARSKR